MTRLSLALVFVLSTSVIVTATDLVDVEERLTAAGVRVMDVELDLAVGQYDISSCQAETDLVAIVTGTYDRERFDYILDLRDRDDRGDLYFSTEVIRRRLSDWDDSENSFHLKFAPGIELRLTVDIGAAESYFDFSELSLAELDLDVGAADAEIRFPTVNNADLRYFVIDAGACDLDIYQIGNTHFHEFEFDGGVGSFLLDFTGEWGYRATADISVGLGAVRIVLPRNVGVRLEVDDNWLSSVDLPKRRFEQVREDAYETRNFDTAAGQLTIYLDLGLGSVDIEFE
jgi:hypothetical protein